MASIPPRTPCEWDDLVAIDRWASVQGLRAADRGASPRTGTTSFIDIYQEVHNFCVVELGGFYLDIIKDRLYTTGAASPPRRSAQTAMYHIAEAMVRWLAPILSFTAEETWGYLPGAHAESVFLSGWHAFPAGRRASGRRSTGQR